MAGKGKMPPFFGKGKGDKSKDDDEKKRIVAAARQRLHQHWDVFADLFPARPFLSGAEAGALAYAASWNVTALPGPYLVTAATYYHRSLSTSVTGASGAARYR